MSHGTIPPPVTKSIVFPSDTGASKPGDDGRARAVVVAVWAIMTGLAFLVPVLASSNLPIGADWNLVSDAVEWNEFQGPWDWSALQGAPVLAGLYRVVLGLVSPDLRLIMFIDAALLSGLAVVGVWAAFKIRGSVAYTDAFFPLLLLNWGRIESFGWAWQATQVLPTAILAIVIVVLPWTHSRNAWVASVLTASGLLVLPFTGPQWAPVTVVVSAWCLLVAVAARRAALAAPPDSELVDQGMEQASERDIARALLAGASGLALLLALRVSYLYWSSGHAGAGLGTSIKLLALSIGPAASRSWSASSVMVLVVVAVTGLAGLRVLRQVGFAAAGPLAGALAALGAAVLASCAVGFHPGPVQDAGLSPDWPPRFAIVAMPTLLAAYFVWGHCRLGRVPTMAQAGLALAALAFLPLNTIEGLAWREWYQSETHALQEVLSRRTDSPTVARQSGEFLARHLDAKSLALRIDQYSMVPGLLSFLQGEGAVDSAKLSVVAWPDEVRLIPHRVTYQLPGATSVEIAWGVNGWQVMPSRWLPNGTRIQNGTMFSPMRRQDSLFTIDLVVPRGFLIDYDFHIRGRDARQDPYLDAGYQATALIEAATVNAAPPGIRSLVANPQPTATNKVTFRYRHPDAGVVVLSWATDRATLPGQPNTTRMIRTEAGHVATVEVPPGATLRYGFQIQRSSRGIVRTVLDTSAAYRRVVQTDQELEVSGRVPIPAKSRLAGPVSLAAIAITLVFLMLLRQFEKEGVTLDGAALGSPEVPREGRVVPEIRRRVAPELLGPALAPISQDRIPVSRSAGLVLHPTELPGGGDLGPSASRLLDFLSDAGLAVWRMLPTGPTYPSRSPFESYSAFAGDPLLIHLPGDSDEVPPAADKLLHLREATDAFVPDPEYQEFLRRESWWLEDYALFMALKAAHHGAPWTEWETGAAIRDRTAIETWRSRLGPEIEHHRRLQGLFFRQFAALRASARDRGIALHGEIPFHLAHDSADVWAHHQYFKLGPRGRLLVRAGTKSSLRPMGFQADYPSYDWAALEANGYDWWARRIGHGLALFDAIGISHSSNFVATWEIPVVEANPANGHFVPGPGAGFFEEIAEQLGPLPIIMEDTGGTVAASDALRARFGFQGMSDLHCSFRDAPTGSRPLPHTFPTDWVVYTSSPGSETVCGWWEGLSREGSDENARQRERTLKYAAGQTDAINWALVRLALSSGADLALIPLADIVGLGGHGLDGSGGAVESLGARFTWDQLNADVVRKLRDLVEVYHRTRRPPRGE